MWCPNCGAFVASGDMCDRCGATVRGEGKARRRRAPTLPTFAKRPAKEKRAGTLGDLFKSDSPFTGEQRAQKPERARGQTFLAWRDARRASAAAPEAPPPRPVRMPRGKPPGPPPQPPRARHSPSASPDTSSFSEQPPAWGVDQSGGQASFAEKDPWSGTYDPPASGGASVQAPPQAAPWAASREWNVLPESDPPSAPIAGSSSGWRVRTPMVDIEEDDPQWMEMPRYGQNGAPVRPKSRAQLTAVNLSRQTLNALLICLILLILAIPIGIGLSHLASLQPQATPLPQANGTPVPTAPVADGFTGYSSPLFSLAYPSGWKHSALDQQLSDGSSAHEDSFADGQGMTASLYTTLGTASLLHSYLDELANDTAGNAALKATTLNETRTYNRTKWVESDYTFSGVVNGKPAQMQMRVLGAIQGATSYIFVLTAPQSSFSQVNSADFEPLLNAFRFY